jgi:hypothetical protein
VVQRVVILVLIGCGSDTVAEPVRDAGVRDEGKDDSGDCSSFAGPYPSHVTPIDRYCSDDSDCTVFVHTVDCARSLVDIGVNPTSWVHLQEGEAEQRAVCTYKCYVPPAPTIADDGTNGGGTSAGNPSVVASVRCVVDGSAGTCVTSFADAGADALDE